MSFTLLKDAILESKYSTTQKQTIMKIQEAVGDKTSTYRLVEAHEVGPEDYSTWLDVVKGFAQENGINIKRKSDFEDVAFAVLENDPKMLDQDMQEAVVNSLWAAYRAELQHAKVQGVTRAKEEEEQVQYALKKMRSRHMEDEQESEFSQAYKSAQGMEDEELWDEEKADRAVRQGKMSWQEFNRQKRNKEAWNHMNNMPNKGDDRWSNNAMEDEEFGDDADGELTPDQAQQWAQQFARGDISAKEFKDLVNQTTYETDGSDEDMTWDRDRTQWDDQDRSRGRFPDEFEDEQLELDDDEFDPRDFYDGDDNFDFGDDEGFDDDLGDEDIIRRGEQMQRGRDLEDFDFASDEGMDRDENIMSRGRDIEKSKRLSDIEPRSRPRALYAEQEEVGTKDYSSPFKSKQLVQSKRDKANYVVEIPDGPGDMVGVRIGNRITMIPSKDLVAVDTGTEEEESTSKQPSKGGRVSFLHDVLTGSNSDVNIKKLQSEIETEAANAWTTHHAKMPKNPHPPGSIAYKAWEKGVKQAATAVWAPKPVLDPKAKTKAKTKPKKK